MEICMTVFLVRRLMLRLCLPLGVVDMDEMIKKRGVFLFVTEIIGRGLAN